jgi:hypothetical protein
MPNDDAEEKESFLDEIVSRTIFFEKNVGAICSKEQLRTRLMRHIEDCADHGRVYVMPAHYPTTIDGVSKVLFAGYHFYHNKDIDDVLGALRAEGFSVHKTFGSIYVGWGTKVQSNA